MIFKHGYTEYYRQSTETITKTPGIGLPSRICHKCGKRGMGMIRKAGTGTSRYNPAVWLCKECK